MSIRQDCESETIKILLYLNEILFYKALIITWHSLVNNDE